MTSRESAETLERRAEDEISPEESHRDEFVVYGYMEKNPDDEFTRLVREKTIPMDRAYRLLMQMARDPETKVQRRDLLELVIDYERWVSREKNRPVSIIIFDIDHFKDINTELNHVGGDQVLVRVAETLQQGVRQSDDLLPHQSTQGEAVTRWGGEEFAVVLPRVNLEQAQRVADRIRVRVENDLQNIRPGGQPVTVSAGVANYDRALHPDAKSFLEDADQQLFAAKNAGRNTVYPPLSEPSE